MCAKFLYLIASFTVLVPTSYAQRSNPCALLSPSELQTLVGQSVGKLFPESSTALSAKEAPGIAVSMRIESCSSELLRPGAHGVQFGTLRAARSLTADEWRRVNAALDAPNAASAKSAQTNSASATSFKPGVVHCERGETAATKQIPNRYSMSCSLTEGATSASVEVEHEQAKALPEEVRVRDAVKRVWERAR